MISTDRGKYKNVFDWMPDENQWWITGFNPEFDKPNPNDMVMVGNIDFSGREEMYENLRIAMEEAKNKKKREYLLFDDNNTVWILWSKGVK